MKTICDLRVDDVKNATKNIHVTNNWKELVEDSEIDIIVELIGGIEPAKSIIIAALKAGKHVVTANKKLLAEAGEEIFAIANQGKVQLGFEASVGGGIPCIEALKNSLVANQVESVMGILNGTTNYILSRMEDVGLSFEEALKEAQAEGFAEVDPTFDIEGFDAGHKITLLAMLAYNRGVAYKDVSIEGITKISPLDIEFSKEMGYIIKLLGICKKQGEELDISVHPTMIKIDHPLASVRNEFNAVMFNCDMTGPVILYGKGAGSHPTASAVMGDIVKIAQMDDLELPAIQMSGSMDILPTEKRASRYYFRMHTEDRAGILEKISGTFAKHNISIASVVQKEGEEGEKYVPLIITTHEVCEAGVLQSMAEINTYDFIKDHIMMIRIEDSK
jgi:homoserine dehydrogenase